MNKIPVILDTDIGGDIDDTWALVMMLRCPELDVKMVVSDVGDTVYRAKLLAKMLDIAGRTDVPVGVGVRQNADGAGERQAAWVKDYDLADYGGKVHDDGVRAMIDAIMDSHQPVTLICIGPMPNIRKALEDRPEIAGRARFVGMHGSFERGCDNKPGMVAEWNVKFDVASARAALSAPWDVTITPLDTCGCIRLDGSRYQELLASRDPVVQALIENYRIWLSNVPSIPQDYVNKGSTILFDTVAIHLAYTTRFLAMRDLNVLVDDEGFTRPDPRGKLMHVAMDWTDVEAYKDDLLARLLGRA